MTLELVSVTLELVSGTLELVSVTLELSFFFSFRVFGFVCFVTLEHFIFWFVCLFICFAYL